MKPVERVEVTCAGCGASIVKRVTDVARNKSGRHFCGFACVALVGGTKPRRGVTLTCEQCGADVYVRQAEAERRRFCSVACRQQYEKRDQLQRTCVGCGGGFVVAPSALKFRKALYCSRACMSRAKSTNSVGRDHNGRPAVIDAGGYIRIYEPDHPKAFKNGWVLEHRWVVEQSLGRYLRSDEHVHHINGEKDDNRLENLVVLGHAEHSAVTAQHLREQAAAAQSVREQLAEYIKRYGPLE